MSQLCSIGYGLARVYECVPVSWHTNMTFEEVEQQNERIQSALKKYKDHVKTCQQCQDAEDEFCGRRKIYRWSGSIGA